MSSLENYIWVTRQHTSVSQCVQCYHQCVQGLLPKGQGIGYHLHNHIFHFKFIAYLNALL